MLPLCNLKNAGLWNGPVTSLAFLSLLYSCLAPGLGRDGFHLSNWVKETV